MTSYENAPLRSDGDASDGAGGAARSWPRRVTAGAISLIVALVALLVMSFMPTEYVLERPGPVYNTVGEIDIDDGESVPLIEVSGADTHETSGSLALTTVEVVGNRTHPVSWIELALAWFDASRAIVPIDAVFPEGVTTEERNAQNAIMMTDSQSAASAAALIQLGYDVKADIRVVSLTDGSPSAGILDVGDRILSANGTTLGDVEELRHAINDAEGGPVHLTFVRDGEELSGQVEPELAEIGGRQSWAVGVSISTSYELPIDVQIQLDNVGGPSAGMMFALGIIDTLTPGELTGGAQIAGTGTITVDGDVGPIGGIRQKLYGARDAGEEYFLAPESNCDEVVGHVPDGLEVISVSTLDEAVSAVEAIAQGEADDLPSCASA